MTQDSVIKAAQYLSRLRSHQDPYQESIRAVVNFFQTDLAGFGRKQGSEIVLHNERFSGNSGLGRDYSPIEADIKAAVEETLIGGFIATRVTDGENRAAILALPIHGNRKVDEVLFVASTRIDEYPREDLEAFLAVAAMVESSIERTRVERENLMGILDAMPDPVHVISEDFEVTYANPAFEAEFGSLSGSKCFAVMESRDGECPWCRLGEIQHGRTVRTTEKRDAGGKVFDILAVPLRNTDESVSMLSILRDITEHRQSQERIEQLLSEKELLLREVHHRIKNNMVTMGSLLSLQRSNIEDEAARDALQDAGNRLSSMMVLYEKLYRNDRTDSVPMDEFSESLVREIAGTFPVAVDLSFSLPDISLPARVATPLAIIVNEIVSNAMKYAFRAGRENKLALTAASEMSQDNRWVVLSIQDNGEGFDPESIRAGFGLGLVDALCSQIGGQFSAEYVDGGRFSVRFPL